MREQAIVARLRSFVGLQHVLTGGDVAARTDDYARGLAMHACCIVRPCSTREVSQILAFCNDVGVKVVPQGGRTGLAGGTRTTETDVALSLERMRSVEPVDSYDATVVVESGVLLQRVQETAEAAGLYYPVDLGARSSATIGGTIATNAGGNSVFRFGMTREQILGIEVVLADGTVLSSMNHLVKNNTGYDLKQLFIGSEGTLGVVTRAVLRLRPDPGPRATALVGVNKFEDALKLLAVLSARMEGALTSFEVMWSDFIDIVMASGRHAWPLDDRHPLSILVETAATHSFEKLEAAICVALSEATIVDAFLAQNLAQADALWKIRDGVDALGAALHPSFIYDVGLPSSKMNDYVATLQGELLRRWPTARMAVFGHIADGNLHLGVHTGNAEDRQAVDDLVYGLLVPLNGSVSAEHGIGMEKRRHLHVSRTREEIALMRQIKAAIDPRNTLNPGKIFC